MQQRAQARADFIRELEGKEPLHHDATTAANSSNNNSNGNSSRSPAFLARGHAFESAAWRRAEFACVELVTVFRQVPSSLIHDTSGVSPA